MSTHSLACHFVLQFSVTWLHVCMLSLRLPCVVCCPMWLSQCNIGHLCESPRQGCLPHQGRLWALQLCLSARSFSLTLTSQHCPANSHFGIAAAYCHSTLPFNIAFQHRLSTLPFSSALHHCIPALLFSCAYRLCLLALPLSSCLSALPFSFAFEQVPF